MEPSNSIPLSVQSQKCPKSPNIPIASSDTPRRVSEKILIRKLKADIEKYNVNQLRSPFATIEMRLTAKLRAALVVKWHILYAPEGLPSPATIDAMRKLGVSHYRVDYIAATVTSYISTSAITTSFPSRSELKKRTRPFAIEDIVAPIHLFQEKALTGRGNYKELSKPVVEAGVTDYTCYIDGKKVVYQGVLGETHTEWFAPGNPVAQEVELTTN